MEDHDWRELAVQDRIAVYRPINPKRFNGTVVVEWLNVSGGTDDSPDWTLAHNELIRDGFAWVGVSAQSVGVDAAKTSDPAEYSSLSHPGDSFSYDIFSQAGQAVRDDAATILAGLRPHTLIAAGESQSAGRLMTYIDAVQPIAHVFRGFLVHSQFGTGASLSQAPQANFSAPAPTTIRSDLGVPVLEFETETDVDNSNLTDRLHYGNPKWFRLWEVAGSSHYDYYGLAIGPNDTGNGQGAVENLAAMQNPTRTPVGGFSCAVPINTGGTHWALDAAVYWLNRWVVDGTPPPRAPPWRRPTFHRWCTSLTPTGTPSEACELHRLTRRSLHWAAKATAGASASFRLHGAVQRGPSGQPLQDACPVRLGLGP